MVEKIVKVTNKGMISIPAEIRKKYKIHDGDHIIVKEDANGTLQLIPVESIEALRARALTIEEAKELFIRSRKEDMELER